MTINVLKSSFTSGELDPEISARLDLEKYGAGCKQLQNFFVQPHGGVYRRPGLDYVWTAPGITRLIPFQFSETQTYVLVFSDLQLNFIVDGGIVESGGSPYSIVTPYTEDELREIAYVQSADVMYLVHPNHNPYKLTRVTGTSWTIAAVSIGSPLSPPTFTATATQIRPVGTGASFTVDYAVTAVSDTEGESLPGYASETNGWTSTGWTAGSYIEVNFNLVTDADRYFIYKKVEGDSWGFIGMIEDTGAGPYQFLDINYDPDTANGLPTSDKNPFSGTDDKPEAVGFHEQRLFFGGTVNDPQTAWGSQTGLFENFNTAQPARASDSVEYILASNQINKIRWLLSFNDLLVGTEGAEWAIGSAASGALTASNVQAEVQSYWGSAKIRPLAIGNSVLHIQRQGNAVRQMTYSFENRGYTSIELSVLADHLFRSRIIYEWDYQENPDRVLWAIRDDGVALGMTYMKEYDIWAWHRHVTDGTFESVAAIPGADQDEAYFVIKRGSDYLVEKLNNKWDGDSDDLEDAIFVDSAISYSGPEKPAGTPFTGATHLANQTGLSALVDGVPYDDLSVDGSGEFTLPVDATVVHIGYPYQSVLEPTNIEFEDRQGVSVGRKKTFGYIIVRFSNTIGGKMGPDLDNLYPIKFTPDTYGNPIQPFTGDKRQLTLSKYGTTGSFVVSQEQALPMTVLALVPKIEVSED